MESPGRGRRTEQAGGVVNGGQESYKDDAKNGETDPVPLPVPFPMPAASAAAGSLPAALPPHHRRSKSASSTRNLEPCKHGAPSRGIVDQRRGQAQNPPDARKSYGTEGVVLHRGPRAHDAPSASPNHRVSLENDVTQLQMHLHQEKSIRIMLDRAIGRASSTLSPGHRHFPAQTKELIAEIELLEVEIANREQHVLSLYRSMFDQCVSGPSSEQSSVISSPAHAKSVSSRTRRWHPSIISSAFCSSKKLPLQPFHIMASVSESGRTNSMLKTKIKHESFSSETLDDCPESLPSDSSKLPYLGDSSLARTLKDHLYQCPSKISEEMVRCMASIYCLLRTEPPEKHDKARSPFLSRSSTSVVLPRRGNGEENNPPNNKCSVEVSSISVNKSQTPDVSCAITHYRLLVEQLERVDPSMSETSIKLAFWINVYNSLVMHAYLAYGIPSGSLRRTALFHKAAYNIGGHAVTANSIEQSLLCCRSQRIGRWFESILSTAMRKKCADEKQLVQLKFGLPECQPLALFALCTGSSSDPMLRVYTAKNIGEELERAKREFLQTGVVVRKSRKVFLPRLVERYAREAGLVAGSGDGILAWVRDNVDGRAALDAIQRCAAEGRRASHAVEWLPYNTRFRYAFAKTLVDKPPC